MRAQRDNLQFSRRSIPRVHAEIRAARKQGRDAPRWPYPPWQPRRTCYIPKVAITRNAISCVIEPHILNIQLRERVREEGLDSR